MIRMYFTPSQLDELYLELVQKEIFFIDGQSSLWVPSQKTKYLDISECKEWPDLHGEMVLMTPGEAARIELERNFGKPFNIVKKKHLYRLDLMPPRYFDGKQRIGYFYYCDLKSAYASIYRPLTLDMVHPRGLGELELDDIGSVLENWKVARNSVIGVTRSKVLTSVKGKVIKEQKFRNPYFNPDLWYTVQLTLHEIANFALRCNTVYISTDCYIFKREKDYRKFAAYLEDNLFKTTVYEGWGFVAGWSSYKVGPKFTKIGYRHTTAKRHIVESEGFVRWRTKIVRLKDVL